MKKVVWPKERFVEFLEKFVFKKYKNHLLILDNKYLFSIPYTPKTNVIEIVFSQIKHYLKLNKKVLRFNEL